MHYIPNFLYIFFFKYNCSAYPWYCGSCCSPRPGTRKTCVLPEAPKYSTVQELTSSQEGCLTTLVLSLLGRRDLSRNIRPLAVLALTTGCSFYFSPQAFFCGRAAFEMASSGTLRVRKLLPPLCFCCSHIFYSPSPNSTQKSFQLFPPSWSQRHHVPVQAHTHGSGRQCWSHSLPFKTCSPNS